MRTLTFSKMACTKFGMVDDTNRAYSFFLPFIALISIFMFDLYTPLGIAAGTLYALIVSGTLWLKGNQSTYITAGFGIALTAIGFYLSFNTVVPTDVAIINRIISVMLIVFTMIIVLQAKKVHSYLSILKTQSVIDPHTQCKNRRAFEQELDFEIRRNKRYKRHLSVSMFEIKDFKLLTLTHGEEAGKEIIKNTVLETQKLIRSTDAVYRIDHNRFAILFSETDLAKAKEVSELICKKLSRKMANGSQITLSAGLSELISSDNLEKLLTRTEEALKLSKKQPDSLVSTFPQTLSTQKPNIPAILSRSRAEMST